MAAGSAFALALALASQSATAEPDYEIVQAQAACGAEGRGLIDAREIVSADELGVRIEAEGTPRITIVGGTFTAWDLRPIATKAEHLCFYATDMTDADWRGANLAGAVFVGVNLTRADLTAADLSGGEWHGANWTSNLEGVRLREANLRGFRFSCGITMDLACGGGGEMDFRDADLTNADLTTFNIWGSDLFAGARLDRTAVEPQSLPHLAEASLAGPLLLPVAIGDEGALLQTVSVTPEEVAMLVRDSRAASRAEPSFACSAARSRSERLICGEWQSDLRQADREMASAFEAARQARVTTAVEQRGWLRRRDGCADVDCMRERYRERIDALLARMGPQPLPPKGSELRYVEEVLPLSDAMRATALYARIAPSLALASMQEATVTVLGDGAIAARGTAIGGNAHMCDLDVARAEYDPATGWYAATGADGIRVPLLRLRGDRLQFRYSGNADTPEAAFEFVSCGMRAAFGEMRKLMQDR
jgi:uncharacterized protein YjbI with pentapeptide repeats